MLHQSGMRRASATNTIEHSYQRASRLNTTDRRKGAHMAPHCGARASHWLPAECNAAYRLAGYDTQVRVGTTVLPRVATKGTQFVYAPVGSTNGAAQLPAIFE